jgi:long-chain acyl-CoA synthetase
MAELISGERRVDLGDINRRAAKAASGLRSLGVGAGDVVALVLRNDFAFFEASYAAGLIGAYPTPVNWHATAAEAQYLFQDSGAKAIVVHADMLPGIEAAIPEGVPVLVVETPPEIARAYGVSPAACAVPAGRTDWSCWLDEFEPVTEGPAEPPGSIIYTSGTTGHPKGVKRAPPSPQEAQAGRELLVGGFGWAPRAANPASIVTVVCGPMYHSAPNAYGLQAGRLGARIVLQPRFDPEELLQLIERHRVTHIHMVPIMFNRLVRLPDAVKAKYDLSSLEYVVHAAAPVSPPIKRAMIEWWGPVIWEYYGSTETSMVVLCSAQEWLAHPGTVGKPVPGADVRVIDADGNALPAGEVGEVVARHRKLADFTYQGDDEKRRRSEKAGLIAPGDVGYFDKDGFLYLCDRAKDMIISGGANIYPAEIEAELHKAPGVADCAVFGIPDEEFGESVCAVIQPQPGVDLNPDEIRGYLRTRIAGYKVPKRIEFAADLPREDSGKIFKRKLREPYWAGLERRI